MGMSDWRAILGAPKSEIQPTGKHPQNPQNPRTSRDPEGFEDFEDIGLKSEIPKSALEPNAARPSSPWPSETALVVQPEWWPGSPFLVVRTERDRRAFVKEGEPAGQVWTLAEARKLAGLSPKEKLTVAQVKAEFGGKVVKSLRNLSRNP